MPWNQLKSTGKTISDTQCISGNSKIQTSTAAVARFHAPQATQYTNRLYKLNTVKQSACTSATNYIDVNIHVERRGIPVIKQNIHRQRKLAEHRYRQTI